MGSRSSALCSDLLLEVESVSSPTELPHVAYFQGKIVPYAEARVGVATHALNYGTGWFGGLLPAKLHCSSAQAKPSRATSALAAGGPQLPAA